jgi:hypothetical protein
MELKCYIYQGKGNKYFSDFGAFMHLHFTDFRKEEKMEIYVMLSQSSSSSSSSYPSALNRITLQPFPYHNHLLTLKIKPTCISSSLRLLFQRRLRQSVTLRCVHMMNLSSSVVINSIIYTIYNIIVYT